MWRWSHRAPPIIIKNEELNTELFVCVLSEDNCSLCVCSVQNCVHYVEWLLCACVRFGGLGSEFSLVEKLANQSTHIASLLAGFLCDSLH